MSKNFKTLEVSRSYKNRTGQVILITGENGNLVYSFDGDDGEIYTSYGDFNLGYQSDCDLIELIEEKEMNNQERAEELIKPIEKDVVKNAIKVRKMIYDFSDIINKFYKEDELSSEEKSLIVGRALQFCILSHFGLEGLKNEKL